MQRTDLSAVLASFALTCLVATPLFAQTPDGVAVFQKACASCHVNTAADSRAPTREALGQFAPEVILTALTTGKMFRQGAELTDAERRAVAGYISGRPIGSAAPASSVGRCASAPPPMSAAALAAGWNGWGNGVTNTRYQPGDTGRLTSSSVSRLTLKWAFGFAGVNSARAQPAVAGGRVFVGSESGDVYALDAKSGCTYWSYHAQAGIRTAVSVGPYRDATGTSGFAVYFSDGSATAYAIDAASGREIWKRKVDDHPYASATGSPTFHEGRLYVTTAAVGEEGQGGRAQYACCTFPRQRHITGREHGQRVVEVVFDRRRAEASRDEQRRSAAVGTRWRRDLVGAHDRRETTRCLCRYRQRLRRARAAHNRRGARARSRHRQDSLDVSAGAQRRLDRRLQGGES